jgi:hypothetical protein
MSKLVVFRPTEILFGADPPEEIELLLVEGVPRPHGVTSPLDRRLGN